MSILVKPNTKVLIQGITGSFGAKHAQLSIDYGTQVVAGVTPGKGGQSFEHGGKKVPIYDTVADAVKQTGATASAVFVPPPFAADAILEGADAGLDLVVAINAFNYRHYIPIAILNRFVMPAVTDYPSLSA